VSSQIHEILVELKMLNDRVDHLERRAGILPPEYLATLHRPKGEIIRLPARSRAKGNKKGEQ
jgi:hypothetical protein